MSEEKKLCDYGCGQVAKFRFKNGKWCCENNISKCPEINKKISLSQKGRTWVEIHGKEKAEKLRYEKIKSQKGKTYIERYGKEKANEVIEKKSKSMSESILNGTISAPSYKYNFLTGYFYSKKNKKNIRYDSSHELAMCIMLENSNDVIKFDRPDFFISYFFENKNKRYHPDFVVDYNDRKELIEVKAEFQMKLKKNLAKWKSAKKYCERNNMKFKVITQKILQPFIDDIYKGRQNYE